MPGQGRGRFARILPLVSRASGWLADAFVEGYGGAGQSFDWSLVPAVRDRPLVLSGGLGVDNVREAIRRVRPWAVDVSSGVESAKGIKDAAKSRRSSKRSKMQMYDLPDAQGHFGPYGGTFVAETLTRALDELRDAYERYRKDPEFIEEYRYELKHFVGRPSPVYHAKRWSGIVGGAQIYLKREDLNHTGAHKINNTIGQAMLARRMGKPRVIAETGAGHAWCRHGDRGRTLRHGVRGVHGLGGHREAPGRRTSTG